MSRPFERYQGFGEKKESKKKKKREGTQTFDMSKKQELQLTTLSVLVLWKTIIHRWNHRKWLKDVLYMCADSLSLYGRNFGGHDLYAT